MPIGPIGGGAGGGILMLVGIIIWKKKKKKKKMIDAKGTELEPAKFVRPNPIQPRRAVATARGSRSMGGSGSARRPSLSSSPRPLIMPSRIDKMPPVSGADVVARPISREHPEGGKIHHGEVHAIEDHGVQKIRAKARYLLPAHSFAPKVQKKEDDPFEAAAKEQKHKKKHKKHKKHKDVSLDQIQPNLHEPNLSEPNKEVRAAAVPRLATGFRNKEQEKLTMLMQQMENDQEAKAKAQSEQKALQKAALQAKLAALRQAVPPGLTNGSAPNSGRQSGTQKSFDMKSLAGLMRKP